MDTVKAGVDSAWRNVIEIRPFRGKGVACKPTMVSASSTQKQSDWLEALAVAAGLLPRVGALHHTEEMAFRPMQAVRLLIEKAALYLIPGHFQPFSGHFQLFPAIFRHCQSFLAIDDGRDGPGTLISEMICQRVTIAVDAFTPHKVIWARGRLSGHRLRCACFEQASRTSDNFLS